MGKAGRIVIVLAVTASITLAACSDGSSDTDNASSTTSAGTAAGSSEVAPALSVAETTAPQTSAEQTSAPDTSRSETSGPESSAPAAGTADAGMAPTEDAFTPLIITPLGLDRIPVRGTDGMFHVAYELEVLNASPRDATITVVESLADDAQGAVVGRIAGPDVVARSLIVGDYQLPPVAAPIVPSGRTVLLLIDDVYARREDIPAQVVNRLEATFGPIPAGQAELTHNFPEQAIQVGAAVRVSDRRPVVIGPPLTGDGWIATNGCCGLSPHRGAMVPVDGRINAAERYGVDWSRFDLTALVDFAGDPADNASYFTYDQPLLAVADATVVTVVSDLPDAPPGVLLPGLTVAQFGGSQIVLDLGSGAYAFYAHMKPGSATVEVGDRVRRGQEIGRIGNSGNTSRAHLHFHLMDGPLPFTDNNLPFEIDHFMYEGTAGPDGVIPEPGERTEELPLIDSVITFPNAE